MSADWTTLARLAEARFRRDAARLDALRREEAELHAARRRLDAEGRAAVFGASIDAAAALATAELWRGWARARRVELATREAELRARLCVAEAQLRRSFGQREAVAREAARLRAKAARAAARLEEERLDQWSAHRGSPGLSQRS